MKVENIISSLSGLKVHYGTAGLHHCLRKFIITLPPENKRFRFLKGPWPMTGFEQVLWYIALPASLFFAIQSVLTLIGITFDHADTDIHHDGDAGHAYFPIFTIRNLIIFLMMFGWTGIAMVRQFHAGIPLTLAVSFLAGLALMLLVALMFFGISKMTSSGTVVVDNSIIGSEAKVYLKIPAHKSGQGKITVLVKGIQKEIQATTEGPDLPTGSLVKITELKNDGSVSVAQL